MIVELVRILRRRYPSLGVKKIRFMLANPSYGLPVRIGKDRLFRILRDNDLLAKHPKKFKQTTDSSHDLTKHPNLIKEMEITKANQVWVSDITYIQLSKGSFAYLSLVTDLYSRKILGYAIHPTLEAEGPIKALKMAIRYAKPEAGLIHHSDKGVQYCCKSYSLLLKNHGIIASMTGAGSCYDNAVAERVNGILKHEFGLGASFPDIDTVKLLTEDSISIYNDERPHLSLNYQTPAAVYAKSVGKGSA